LHFAGRAATVPPIFFRSLAMILELVTFKSPAGWDRDRVLDDAKHVVAKWAANKELVRKHFLLGIGEAEGTGAGVYLWPSIEAAKRAHNAEWQESVKTRTGDYATIRYFDLMLLVDNENGRVTEWDGNGAAHVLEHA
jgi:hypothetical protein